MQYEDQHIDILWQTVCVVKELNHVPELWKLDDVFIRAVMEHEKLEETDDLAHVKLFGAAVDFTTNDPILIANGQVYQFLRSM